MLYVPHANYERGKHLISIWGFKKKSKAAERFVKDDLGGEKLELYGEEGRGACAHGTWLLKSYVLWLCSFPLPIYCSTVIISDIQH